MYAENEFYAGLVIESGTVSARSSWIFHADDLTSDPGTLLTAARTWAGTAGSPMRVPASDMTHYTESSEFQVTKIEFEPIDRSRCRISYAAESAVQLLSTANGQCTEFRNRDGSITRKASWTAASASVFPVVGSCFEWDGGAFQCEECQFDLTTRQCTLTAREVTTRMLGGIERSGDEDGISVFKSLWFVASSAITAFLSAHSSGSAATWAGSNFFELPPETQSAGRIGFQVTLTAREVLNRRLSITRSAEITGVNALGNFIQQVVWRARYQVPADAVVNFRSLGGTAASWAGGGCIVSSVKETRLSPAEYRVDLEARPASGFHSSEEKDDDAFSARTELKCDVSELYCTPEMAGYCQAPFGCYQPIPEWEPANCCPFSVSSPLDENYIGAVLRLMQLTVTTYRTGSCSSLWNELKSWNSTKVDSGPVGGCTGSFLRVRQSCTDHIDGSGTHYVKLVRIYHLAPDGMSWNSTYWSGL